MDRLEGVKQQLDRIEGKLDSHLERITRVEEQTKGNRGAITLMFSTILVVIGWLISYFRAH